MKWLVAFLAVCLIAPSLVYAGDESDPEIFDEEDADVVDYLDLVSAWFYEEENEPEYLFTALKMKEINPYHPKQHLVVHWTPIRVCPVHREW